MWAALPLGLTDLLGVLVLAIQNFLPLWELDVIAERFGNLHGRGCYQKFCMMRFPPCDGFRPPLPIGKDRNSRSCPFLTKATIFRAPSERKSGALVPQIFLAAYW